jgi:hypothetical protein
VTQPLEYATPPEGKGGHSVWAIAGFSLAVIMAIGAGISCWVLFRSLSGGSGGTWFGVSPLYYVMGGVAVVLCGLGLRRGRKKSLALIGFGLVVLSCGVMVVLVARSPW